MGPREPMETTWNPHGKFWAVPSKTSCRRSVAVQSCGFLRLIFLMVLLGALCALGAFTVYASAEDSTGVPQHQTGLRGFERAIARVQPLIARYGYGAAALAAFVEGIGIPLPGQTLLIATALEAAMGRLSISLTLVIVTFAGTLGNSAGYAIGRWGGRTVLNKLQVNVGRQERLDAFFKRRGGLVILIARFIDGLRQLNGIVAGISRMPWWTFTAYNVAGAILWTFTWGLGAFYLGRDIHRIAGAAQRHHKALFFIGAVALVGLVVCLLRRSTESKGTG